MRKLTLELEGGGRSYPILIERNLLERVGEILKSQEIGNDIFIISETKVASLYLESVIKNLRDNGFKSISHGVIPEGEENKSWKSYEFLLRKLNEFDKNLDKNIVVLCLGGGVVGDLGGFVAGTYRRGVNYVQIPTTLLAQVDCGVGGKVGINYKNAKNLVGMFYQPRLVLVDPMTLRTLDKREIRSGLAEVVKYGIIKDPSLLDLLEVHIDDLLSSFSLNLNMELFEKIIFTSLKIKSDIVKEDERDEKDIRIVLNLGHTVGHALEAAFGYRVYKHGEALSIGILAALEISQNLGILKDKTLLARIENILKNIGLPLEIESCLLDDVLESMKYDKKFKGGKTRFVLPVKAGEIRIVEGVKDGVIIEVLKKRMIKKLKFKEQRIVENPGVQNHFI